MRTPITVAAAATGLLLVGGGTAFALGAGADEPVTAITTAAAEAPALPGAAAAPGTPVIDRAAAERIAIERAGGGQVVETEFDRADDDRDDQDDRDDRDDRDHWEVEVRTADAEHDIDVDAATGEVLDHDSDRDDRDDDSSDDDGINGINDSDDSDDDGADD